jgi:hypothetical protein
MFRKFFLIGFFVAVVSSAWGQEDLLLSGEVRGEAGVADQNRQLGRYEFSRVLVRGKQDLNSDLSWTLEGEAAQQTSPNAVGVSWPVYSTMNRLSLEGDDTSNAQAPAMARLDRAFVKWTSGRLEVTAGLQSFDNDSPNFYSPTHYFDPLPILSWFMDEPLGSEGARADCFLFDDLSLEGSTRFLSDGTTEWTARLIDRGIGIALTPSFAHLENRDGAGLELSGTFPDFQVRFEGADWFQGGAGQFEWVAALSTVIERTKFSFESLQDALGGALGPGIDSTPGGFYFFASTGRDITAQWHTEMALLEALPGGSFLFWPKADWAFETNWKLRFQAQWWLGTGQAPAQNAPGITGLSMAYSF